MSSEAKDELLRSYQRELQYLRSMGAEARRLSESGADYVRRLIASGFLRRLRHPGNLAFTWKF